MIGIFNQFHCSSSRYTDKNIGHALAVLTKYGLASVGTAHSGAMLWPYNFEYHLKLGVPWAEAGKLWFNQLGWRIDRSGVLSQPTLMVPLGHS